MQPFSLAFFSFLEARRTYLAFLGNSNAHETALESSNNGGRSSGTAQTGNNENSGYILPGITCSSAENTATIAYTATASTNACNAASRLARPVDTNGTFMGDFDSVRQNSNKKNVNGTKEIVLAMPAPRNEKHSENSAHVNVSIKNSRHKRLYHKFSRRFSQARKRAFL